MTDTVLAVVATPYDETVTTTLAGPSWPFGVQAFGDGGDWTYSGGETAVHLADRPFITEPGDDPADTIFEPRLIEPFSYRVRLFDGTEPGGRTRPGFGDIVALNGDGGLDDRLGLGWDARRVALYEVDRGAAWSTATLRFSGRAAGLSWDRGRVSIELLDGQGRLARPLQTNFYSGDGGIDGNDDVAGKPRPVLLGSAFNLSPVLIDAADLVYQFHDGQADSVSAVRDKGVALTSAGDVADVWAWSPTGGQYVTDLAQGLIRLGSKPQGGRITADAIGATWTDGGYTTAKLARWIVTTRLGVESFADPGEIDTAAFAAFEAAQSAAIGYYVDTEQTPTAAEVLDEMLAAVGGYWHVTLAGLFAVGILIAPSGTADATLTEDEIVGRAGVTRQRTVPAWRNRVGWRRNWTIQSPDDLAGAVSDADAQLYGAEYRFASAQDSGVRTKHLAARVAEVRAFFVSESDADTEAARRQTLYGAERSVYRVSVKGHGAFSRDPGALIDWTGFGRFGFAATEKFILVGLEVSVSGRGSEVVWELWG